MGLDPYALNPKREKCVRCGEVAKGSAQINGERYCHSDDPYPTCYMVEQWQNASDTMEALVRVARKDWAADGYRTVSFQHVLEHFRLTEEDLAQPDA